MLQMAGRMAVLGTETAFEVLARANALAAQGRSIINLGIKSASAASRALRSSRLAGSGMIPAAEDGLRASP